MHKEHPKEIFFHVGLARTASTYLQHKVFPQFQGVHYIAPNKYRRYRQIISDTNSTKYLVSREFDQRLESESRKFSQCFPDAKIIIVLRRNDSWIASQYRRFVKNGYALSFQEFFDIDHDKGLWKINNASMFTKLQIIEKYFRHKPLVMFHENLSKAPFDFFDKMALFMGSMYDRESISLQPFHTSYSDKQLQVMLRVSKFLFSMNPTYDNHARWVHWLKRRSRLLACYLVLYPAWLVPAALVSQKPLIAPQTLEKIQAFFAEDWQRCQEYALKNNGALSSRGLDYLIGHPDHQDDAKAEGGAPRQGGHQTMLRSCSQGRWNCPRIWGYWIAGLQKRPASQIRARHADAHG